MLLASEAAVKKYGLKLELNKYLNPVPNTNLSVKRILFMINKFVVILIFNGKANISDFYYIYIILSDDYIYWIYCNKTVNFKLST